jgi:hypothetical protein
MPPLREVIKPDNAGVYTQEMGNRRHRAVTGGRKAVLSGRRTFIRRLIFGTSALILVISGLIKSISALIFCISGLITVIKVLIFGISPPVTTISGAAAVNGGDKRVPGGAIP